MGEDMALSLSKKGIDVIMTYNTSKEEADKVVIEINALEKKALTLQLDVSDISSLDNFIVRLSFALKESLFSRANSLGTCWDTGRYC